MFQTLGKSARRMVVATALILMPTLAHAQTVDVRFPRGSSGTTIEGSVTGNSGIKYRIGVNAGQTMSVQLDTNNASNYFNITAPGATEALYNSSIDGNGTSFVVPSSGDYTIDVYLMRNAARRNETSDYSLTIYVEGGSGQSQTRSRPVAPPQNGRLDAAAMNQMPRFCVGEASAKFEVRPQDLTTNVAMKSGKNYLVQGYFDGSNGTTFFNCYFSADGTFQSVN